MQHLPYLYVFAVTLLVVANLVSIHGLPFGNGPRLLSRKVEFPLAPDWDPKKTPYPVVRRDETSFSYRSEATKGNVTISDPYNYLEQPISSSKEVKSFIDQQTSSFKSYFEKSKDIDAIRSSIKDAGNYDELSFPEAFGSKENPIYTFRRRELGSESHDLFVAHQVELDQAMKDKFSTMPGKKIVDEASLGKDQSIFYPKISPDGKKLLFHAVRKSSGDLSTIHVRDISSISTGPKSSNIYTEVITGNSDVKDGWTADSNGFFYTHQVDHPDGIKNESSILYHKLGTAVEDDIVIVKADKTGPTFWDFDVSDDKKFLVVYAFPHSNKCSIYVAPLDQPISPKMKWLSIAPDAELELDYVTNLDNEFYFLARYDNHSNQVLKYKIDPTKIRQINDFKELKEKAIIEPTVIPENKEAMIEVFTVFDTDKVFLSYTQDANRQYYIYDLVSGKRIQHVLPDFVGSSSSITSLFCGTSIFLWSWTFNTPGQLYHIKWDRKKGLATSDLIHDAKVQSIDPTQFIIEQKWAISKDSTKVPFHLFYRKGAKMDGTRPAMINFMGAFGYIGLPYYSPTYISWVRDYDGVFILAYPRGGSEVKGEAWHQAALLEKKQNTIDDINAIVQYLIDNKIAAKGKVILYPEHFASTLAMAATNQAPEGNLGAVILQDTLYGYYGLYDLLRFSTAPSTSYDVAEYGDPQDPKGFDWLRKISSLHNVDQNKTYPSILFLPGKDEIVSWHGRKMVAELQHVLPNNPNPFFFNAPDPNLSDQEYSDFESVILIAHSAHVLGLQRVKK